MLAGGVLSNKHVKWLSSELSTLTEEGIITSDVADRIRGHYSDEGLYSGRRIALTICSILGAILIGSGIILLLAHNWSQLSRPMRTLLSIAPLFASQLIAFWVIWAGKKSAAWCEGVGVFLTLSIGASISLVAQTYHIAGDLGGFLFIWSLLTLPVVYLLGSSLSAVVYLAGITFWSGYEQSCSRQAVLFWPLLAAAIPHVRNEIRKDIYSVRSVWLCWAVSICLCVATGIVLEKTLPGLWIIVYSSLFSVMYFAGAQWFNGADGILKKPFHTVGSAGIAVLALLFTFEFPWNHIGWHYYRYASNYYTWAALPDYILTVGLVIAAVFLFVRSIGSGEKHKLYFGVFPILAVVSFCIATLWHTDILPMILFNIYMFVLGLGTIIYGIKTTRLSLVNSGMVVFSALIISRFFDSNMGFIARGIVFIVLGIGFLAANLIVGGRMKNAAE